MDWTHVLSILIQALQLILGLSLLVFIHELGHFLFARLFGMKVNKFYLFFDAYGYSLFKFKSSRTGTVYGLGWLPFGGYCKIAGMIDESYLTEGKPKEAEADEFRSKPAWQRLLVMLGGVLFNFILALIIYTGISYTWGDLRLNSKDITAGMIFSPAAQEVGFRDGDIILSVDGREQNALSSNFMRDVIEGKKVQVLRNDRQEEIIIPTDMMQRIIAGDMGLMSMQVPFVVKETLPKSAAQKAGLMAGDKVISINGLSTPDITDVQNEIRKRTGQEITLQTVRQGGLMDIPISVDSTGIIGVQLMDISEVYPVQKIHYSLWQSIPRGWEKGIATLKSYAGDMKYVFTREGAGQMGGLISIGKLFPSIFNWYSFWQICALLSIIFAFMNFIPIPGLDGGHIVFTLWELITRRKVSDKILIKAQMVGMFILFVLLIYANVNDIIKLF